LNAIPDLIIEMGIGSNVAQDPFAFFGIVFEQNTGPGSRVLPNNIIHVFGGDAQMMD
jgi:hypothetical protein